MKIEILHRTTIAGRPVAAGDVVDVEDRDARYLIGARKAQEAAGAMPVAIEPAATGARRPRPRKPLAA